MATRKPSRSRTENSSEVRSRRTPARSGRVRKTISLETRDDQRRMPPVLVRRSGQAGLAGQKGAKSSRQPRRRFDIALSSPGVEVRLPALPAVKFGWRLASFTLLFALLGLSYYFLTSPTYQVQFAELQGETRLNSQDINQAINLYNQSIFSINPAELELALQAAFPELTGIDIRIGLPAVVQIQVVERTPVISWQEQARTRWVDLAGVDFTPRGEFDGLVPVLAYAPPPTAFEPQVPADETTPPEPASTPVAVQPFIEPELVEVILSLAMYTPQDATLVFDPEHGLGWHDPRGWDVYFGLDTDDIQLKLNVYQAITQDLQSRGITPALISVEYIHAPYYRMER